MMHMDTEFTIKCEFGIPQGLVVFGGGCRTRRCVDEDSRPFDNFGLVGMQDGNVIKGAIESTRPLPSHQWHIGIGLLHDS